VSHPAPEPPAFAERLLQRALARSGYADSIVGDLHEAFDQIVRLHSSRYAAWWYRREALRLMLRYSMRDRRGATRRSPALPQSGGQAMDWLMMDLKLAMRALIKRPLLTSAVVLTLALGLGTNAAIFKMIDALVVRPFSFRDVDKIVMLVESVPNDGSRRETVAPANFVDWKRRSAGGALERLAAFEWWDVNLMGRDVPERALGFYVSADFFRVLGVPPALGRGFLPDDETPGRNRLVILSDGLFRRRFGADRSILGQSILVDAVPSTVVGIMPPGFDFPLGAEIWAPLAFDGKTAALRTSHYLSVLGRLAEGHTQTEAQAEMKVIGERLAHDFPDANKQRTIRVFSLPQGMLDAGLGPVLSLWQAAGLFVLLIACANIANLLLARGAERGREIAVRLALGSSRARIVGASMIESGLMALLAVPLSVGVSWAALRLIRAFMPPRVVRFVAGWNDMAVDWRLVAATTVLAALAALIAGVLPALQLSRGQVAVALKSDGRTGAGPGRQRLRRALVIAELALALPLLVTAMLSVTSVSTYLTGWQGYDPRGLLTMRVVLPESQYPDAERRRRFAADAIDRIAAQPGVDSVAATNALPSGDSNTSRKIEIDGQSIVDPSNAPRVDYRAITPAYFDTLRLPLRRGRAFTSADRADGSPVAIVSESMARKYWPARDPIGSRVKIGDIWVTVVGVCGDVIHDWFDRRNAPTLYRPSAQAPTEVLMLAIRTAADPLSLAPRVRAALTAVDPAQPVFDIMTMGTVLSEKTIGLQYIAGIMGAFAALALVLAVLGLYAVMTFMMTQRTREIGVRMALGASARDITRLALWQAARLTALGVLIGLGLAVMLGRLMVAGLLGVVSSDATVSIGLALALGATALAASYLPARRAASVDPITALRTE
jgi:putative ABC transport system permease protein